MLSFNAYQGTLVCVCVVCMCILLCEVCVVFVVVFKAYGVKRDFKNRRLRRQRTTIREGDDSFSTAFSYWQLLDELRHVCGVVGETQQCVFFVQQIVRNRNQRKPKWKTQNVKILTRVSRFERTKRLRKNSARIRNVENSIPKITIFKNVLENFSLFACILYIRGCIQVYNSIYINCICYRSLGISNIKTNNS